MPNHKTKKPTERAKSSNTLKTTNKSSKSTSVSNSSYTPKSSLPSKTLKLIKKHKIISALLLILLIWLTYTQTMNYLEKYELLNKQKKIEKIANEISAYYPPDERKVDRYCDYSSRKFSKGDLSCDINIDLYYWNKTAGEADKIKANIANNLDLNLKESTYPPSQVKNFIYDNGKSSWNLFYSDLSIDKCSIYYSYDIYQKNENTFSVNLHCFEPFARSEHFPVKKP